MCFMHFILLISIIANEINSEDLTNSQQKCLISIAQNLNIKQIVFVSETNKFSKNNILILKNFNKHNFFTQFLNLVQLNQSRPIKEINYFKFKTLYFLHNYTETKNLELIFNSLDELLLSENVWVVFNENYNDFNNLYIPYNCQFLVIGSDNNRFRIKEIFNMRIFTNDLYVSEFAEMEEEKNLKISEPDFYQRRFNMNGTLLVVINIYFPNSCPHVGLCAYEEIIKEMGRMLNFRPEFMRMKHLRKLWEENVELLYEIWMEFFVFDTYTYWKYSIAPIWKTPAFIHIKYIKPYEQGENSPHLRPFATNVWISIIIWLIISGICVTFIDLKIRNKNFSIIDSIFRSFESFTNQCGCLVPNAISSRIAAIMTRAGPVFLVPIYSAVVISFVTVKITNLPFNDLQGLIKDGSFKFGYENNTLIGKILRESTSIDARRIHEKLLVPIDELPNNLDEAIDKICANPKFAYAFFNNDLFSKEQKCKIVQIPKSIYETWDAIRLRGRSPYYKILNRMLKSFRSSGVLKRMEKIVYGEKPKDEAEHKVDPVEFVSVVELLLTIFSLYLIVPFILMAEFLVHKTNRIKK